MELKDAYIDEIICHHFSMDPSKCLVNSGMMDLSKLDTDVLKNFFIKPFASVKTEFCFSHPVDLSYNVVYQTVLKIEKNEDFVKCSQDIYHQLQASSTQPTIKDGDVFVARISDILLGDSYFDGLGIFKIERKSDFLETYLDEDGNLQFVIKSGIASNKLDKACLIVYEERMPKCLIIDTSNDTKFWRQDFLGLIPKPNSYSQSRATIQVFQSFVKEELSERVELPKDEQVGLINSWAELVKKSDELEIESLAKEVLADDDLTEMFSGYYKAFEEKEGMSLSGRISIDKKAITVPKKVRTIKLDDAVEINLIKSGSFIERGFDEDRGMHYYKLYFSNEK